MVFVAALCIRILNLVSFCAHSFQVAVFIISESLCGTVFCYFC